MIGLMKSPEAAWLLLCGAVALHVVDEAVNDFLSFYNPLVESISWLPMPLFTFEVWIAGLILAIVVGLAATSSVTNRVRTMRWVGIVVSVIMILNGLAHVAFSVVRGELLPGALSSPVLVAVASWVIDRFSRHWDIARST